MKKSLTHLPKHKRDEIRYITKFIRDKSKYADMIILFGSYARGDWVEIRTPQEVLYEKEI